MANTVSYIVIFLQQGDSHTDSHIRPYLVSKRKLSELNEMSINATSDKQGYLYSVYIFLNYSN